MDNKRILIIEDDASFRRTLVKALLLRGYQAESTDSFARALQIAKERFPDAIVIDIHLGEDDGRDLLNSLRSDPNFSTCQIIVMTGQPYDATQRETMNLGADDYLEKPFSIETFIQCIDSRMNRRDLYLSVDNPFVASLKQSIRSTIPHEFLTPLNGIIGLSNFLQDAFADELPEQVRATVDDINKCGCRLLRSIQNYLAVLDVMQHPSFESGATSQIDATTLNSVLARECASIAQSYNRSGDLQLVCEIDSAVSFEIAENAFAAMVRELVDNAFKFSPKKASVKISIQNFDSSLLLSVKDFGIGMSRDQIKNIGAFTQFERDKREQQGLGLGLKLTKKIAKHSGGELDITSKLGLGTLVTISWNNVIAAKPEQSRTPSHSSASAGNKTPEHEGI